MSSKPTINIAVTEFTNRMIGILGGYFFVPVKGQPELDSYGYDRKAYAEALTTTAKALVTDSEKLFKEQGASLKSGYADLFDDGMIVVEQGKTKMEVSAKEFAQDSLYNALSVIRQGKRGTDKRALVHTIAENGTKLALSGENKTAQANFLLHACVFDKAGFFNGLCELYLQAVDTCEDRDAFTKEFHKFASKASRIGVTPAQAYHLIEAGSLGKESSKLKDLAKSQLVMQSADLREAFQRIQYAEKLGLNQFTGTNGFDLAKEIARAGIDDTFTPSIPNAQSLEALASKKTNTTTAASKKTETATA